MIWSGLASWHPPTLLFLLYVTNSINQFYTYETSTSPRFPTKPFDKEWCLVGFSLIQVESMEVEVVLSGNDIKRAAAIHLYSMLVWRVRGGGKIFNVVQNIHQILWDSKCSFRWNTLLSRKWVTSWLYVKLNWYLACTSLMRFLGTLFYTQPHAF